MSNKKLKSGISLCMIVKNEERSLAKCLESVKDLVNQIVIVDTGSTDKTIEIGKSFGADIHYFKWCDDFSLARNFSINLANYKWILILDADEILDLQSTKELKQLSKKFNVPTAFEFRVVSDTGSADFNESRVIRMFSNGYNIKYKNKVHEQISASIKEIGVNILRSNSIIHHDGYNSEFVDQKAKQKRNIPLLEQMMKEEPEFYYWPYNLGISHLAIGNNDLAIDYLNQAFNEKLHVNIKAAILNILGGIYKNQENWEKVKDVALKSVKMVEHQYLGYMLLVYFYNNCNDYEAALKYINKLISIHDSLSKEGSHLNNDVKYSILSLENIKGVSLHGAKKYEIALESFENILNDLRQNFYSDKLNKNDKNIYVECLRSAIGCSRDMNNIEKVITLVKEYIDLFPEDLNGYSLLGEAFTLKKEYSESLKVYLKANSLFPDNHDIQKKIATMFTLLGNETKAEEWLYKMAGLTDLT